MAIIVFFLFLWLFFKGLKALFGAPKKRQARLIQEASVLVSNTKGYIREVQKATTISSFLENWKKLKDTEQSFIYYKKKISDWNIKSAIEQTCQAISGIDKDAQMMLCTVIERMRRKVVREMKTTYKYSPETKELLFNDFKKEIIQGYKAYSDDTRLIAESVLNEVASVAGQTKHLLSNPNRSNYDESDYSRSSPSSLSIDFDNMEGHQFEYFCADLLRRNGFENVQVTRASGDNGIDILAEKDEIRYAIQCKCFSSDLGNKPVQEAYTGKKIYKCQIAAVMTNRFFTDGAREAARATGVLLWDRNRLLKFINNAQEQEYEGNY